MGESVGASGGDAAECSFSAHAWFQLVLGLVIIVGVGVSYAAQYIEIVVRRSSRGISAATVFLGCVCTWTNSQSALIKNWGHVACCSRRAFTFWQCQSELLAFYQVFAGALCNLIFFVFVLAFFPREDVRARRWAAGAFFVFVVVVLVGCTATGALLGFVLGFTAVPTALFADALAVVSSIAIIIQWSPQIVKTFLARDKGSLSIPMLILQAPGSFLCVVFEALYKQSPFTWMPFLLTGIQQVVLLVECIVFRRLRPRAPVAAAAAEAVPQKAEAGNIQVPPVVGEAEEAQETDPLLDVTFR